VTIRVTASAESIDLTTNAGTKDPAPCKPTTTACIRLLGDLTVLGTLSDVLDNEMLEAIDDGSFEDLAAVEGEGRLSMNSHDFWVHVAATVDLWTDDIS
jgi:hypothetical protein